MTATYQQAEDETFALFNVAWKANTAAVVGYVPDIFWEGKETSKKPDNSKAWCRVSMNSVDEAQATLSDCVSEPGAKRYESSGIVFVQIFVPRAEKNARIKGRALATIARNAYRGKSTSPGKVWFRRVRINNIPPEEASFRFNVVAEYEFDEIG